MEHVLFRAAAGGSGHAVVVTPNYGAPESEEIEGMRIYRYPFPQKLGPGRLARASLHANPLFYLYSAWRITGIARREGLQVLHAQNIYSEPGVVMAARWLGLPSVFTLRDVRSACVLCGCLHRQDFLPEHCSLAERWRCVTEFDRRYNSGKGLFYRTKWYLNTLWQKIDLQIRSFFLRRVDRVISISDGLKEIYVRAGRFPAGRARTIYNFPPTLPEASFDADELKRRYGLEGRRVILAVGKMSFGKGSDILLAALPIVVRSVPDAALVFVGRENSLIQIPPEQEPFVFILGVKPLAETLHLYRIADVVAFPVVGPEGQGRVLLEAMSLARPVVASRAFGIPETVLDGESGLLVERGDPQALADALIRVLKDPELACRLGNRGRELLLERFNPDRILQEHLAAYTGVRPA
jgi:glycosyltransferase involved in cell wall biosynthesis